MREPSVACTLSERDLAARRASLFAELRQQRLEIRWLPDGAAFRYRPGPAVLASLAEFVQLESKCCPFLRFRLTVEPASGPLWLELTGPSGTRELLATEVGDTADDTAI